MDLKNKRPNGSSSYFNLKKLVIVCRCAIIKNQNFDFGPWDQTMGPNGFNSYF